MTIQTIAYGGYTINREVETIVNEDHPFGSCIYQQITYNFTTKNWTQVKQCPPNELQHYLPVNVIRIVMNQWPEDFRVYPMIPQTIPPMSDDTLTTILADEIFKEND